MRTEREGGRENQDASGAEKSKSPRAVRRSRKTLSLSSGIHIVNSDRSMNWPSQRIGPQSRMIGGCTQDREIEAWGMTMGVGRRSPGKKTLFPSWVLVMWLLIRHMTSDMYNFFFLAFL